MALNDIEEGVINHICEYEGICNLFNDFLAGDYFNPYPFHRNLIIQRMKKNIDNFGDEWKQFIHKHSPHRM